jgi:hypothetical protein
MYFKLPVVATELRAQILGRAAPQFWGCFFLTAAQKRIATKGQLNEMKARIRTRHDSVAATSGQFAAGSREGKAKM